MKATLTRHSYSPFGVFGVIDLTGGFSAHTVERPWENNQPNVSCIPIGEYKCKRVDSPKFGDSFEITGVRERTHILFHAGNTRDDLLGCVALGQNLGFVDHNWAVLASKQALKYFMLALKDVEEFDLEIKNYAGGVI